jgi:soluble lytic murein transglycosylase-like protein
MKSKLMMIVITIFVFELSAYGQNNEAFRRRAKLIEPAIVSTATRHRIDPRILWTIAYLESRFDPTAISYKRGVPCAFGMMQFIPLTSERYGLRDPHDPVQSLDAGARYLSDLLKRFRGRVDLVMAAYNSGEGTVEAFRDGKRVVLSSGKIINPGAIRTGGIPPYDETQRYVSKGLQLLKQLNLPGLSSRQASRPLVESVYPSTTNSTRRNSTSPAAQTQSVYVN